MKKILLIGVGRGGTTWVYHSVACYMNFKHNAEHLLDEPIAMRNNKQQNQSNINKITSMNTWVCKVLIDNLTPNTNHLYNTLLRNSTLSVNIVRKQPIAHILSRCVSDASRQYANVTSTVEIPDDIVFNNCNDWITYSMMQKSIITDKTIFYEDLHYPRQIYSIISDIPMSHIAPTESREHKSRATIVNQQHVYNTIQQYMHDQARVIRNHYENWTNYWENFNNDFKP